MTMVGCTVLFCESSTKRDDTMHEDHDDAGLCALREQKFGKAADEFAKAGNPVRQAEVFYYEGRYDDAAALCGRHPADPTARYILALVACKRGDHAAARDLLAEAKEMGSVPAGKLLAVPRWWEVV